MIRAAQSVDDWSLLSSAAHSLKKGAFEEYFVLKKLLEQNKPSARTEFTVRFSKYFGLNSGGITDEFKDIYFRRLFEFDGFDDPDPYTPLLVEFFDIPRRNGSKSLQVSFTSKLVAIWDDARPIYDRHVCDFFGLSVPAVRSVTFRIDRFLQHLNRIEQTYDEWRIDSRFPEIVDLLYEKQPQLRSCHPSRICDFLVWTIGSSKLHGSM